MSRYLVNGVHLNATIEGSGTPLLLLHGFTGSAGTWRSHVEAFRRDRMTIAVDLLGHGASDTRPEPARYSIERAAEDLLALLDQLGVGQADILGYSMGARIALRLAVDHGTRVRTLLLESPSAGIRDPDERRRRAKRDEAMAALVERDGVASFVDVWEAQPLFASHARLPADARETLRTERLANPAAGLAGTLRGAGPGVQEPLHDHLAEVTVPTLLIVGELDAVGRARAEEIAARLPNATLVTISGAGHTPHLERPDEFRAAVQSFLGAKSDQAPALQPSSATTTRS